MQRIMWNITAMQENLRYYRKLEQEANPYEIQIADLGRKRQIYRASHDEKQKVEIYINTSLTDGKWKKSHTRN
jgi:alpha-D-ribose 1-methylphosphonate 5-triphosphate diphosphatase PhnM